MGKPWYASKTMWVNMVTLTILIITTLAGIQLLPNEQLIIIPGVVAFVNLLLRAITKEPLWED